MRLGAMFFLGPCAAAFNGANLNGEYLMQRTPHQGAGNWSTNFSEYPGGVEYFEVYAGPVTSTYAEVFWTALPEVDLPVDVVARFDGKAMAVVGFEIDQVRRLDANDSTKDVSVPINIAYNHHYGANMHGKGTVRGWERITAYNASDTSRIAHHPSPKPGFREVAKVLEPNREGYPSSFVFGYSNGGEFRKTYHGLAPPYAQIIGSPQRIAMSPMQVCFYLPLHFKRILLTILTCPPHILTFKNPGRLIRGIARR